MFEFLFGVSRDLISRGELLLMSDWPRWILVAALLSSAAVLVASLLRQRRTLTGPQLGAIGLLQLSMVAVVLLILWEPGLRTERLRAGDNVVAVMLDTSESMVLGDSRGSRMELAEPLIRDRVVPALQQEHVIQQFYFSDRARAADSDTELPTPGRQTRIGASVLQVLRQARTTPLGAVILISDGADNAGGQFNDQLAEIARFGVPVHTIGIGREAIPEDLELADVTLPAKALPGTTLSARVAIRHDGAATARVKISDGDSFLGAREVSLPADANVTTAWIDFPVPDPGHHDLVFSLDRIDGERNGRNNSRGRALEVPEERYRILYLEGEPRWEYKFLRRALNEDSSVELVSVLRVSPNKFYRQGIDTAQELQSGFPADRAALFAYDALIIGSIEAARFSAEQQAMLQDFVGERGGSLLMLAGPAGLGAGGWGNSAVSLVLPSRLGSEADNFRRHRVTAALTALGRQSPMLRLSDSPTDNDRLWRALPEIADYQTIGPLRPAAVSLLEVTVAGRREPLLVTQPYGRGQSFILATAGTWRWQMSLPLADQSHETFWRQLARGLVANSPDRFELSTQVEGGRVKILAELRDKDFEALQDVAVTALVATGDSEALSIELRPSETTGMLEGEFTPHESGTFFVEAIARRNDMALDTARLSLHYEAPSEHFDVRQNRELLETLAAASGGQYWLPEQIEGLASAVRHSAAGVTEENFRPLWDAPVIFFLLLLLKASEWLLRRRWRAI